jgi:hypothetical protein
VEYPNVLSEAETLERVLAGASLARYGDGEFTLAEGRSIVNQPRGDLSLSRRLRGILHGDGAPCVVGIPNIHSPTPKAVFWSKYLERGAALLHPSVTYGSSFISRPDSAPWIDTADYWLRLESLWTGKHVTLVRGEAPAPHPKKIGQFTGGVSLIAEDLTTASSVTEVVGPSVDAWSVYPALMEQIGTPQTVLICLGAAATVMAVDLCAKGVHAIDLGHVGMFRRKHLRGESAIQWTPAEKAAAAVIHRPSRVAS